MMKRLHNDILVHVLNEEGTEYTVVLVSKTKQYVFYSPSTGPAVRAASKLIVHRPDFLDRRHAPLWCSHDGKYVKTAEATKKLKGWLSEDDFFRGLIYD
jgi:hypothetical protein